MERFCAPGKPPKMKARPARRQKLENGDPLAAKIKSKERATMEIDDGTAAAVAAAAAIAGASPPNGGDQSDEAKNATEDLIMAPGVVSFLDQKYDALTEDLVGPAADLGLHCGEYYIPDAILDRIEATGHDNPDCEMEEEAEEEEDEFDEAVYDQKAVYDSTASSLGFQAADSESEICWSAPPSPPKSVVKYDEHSKKEDAVEASLGALPETLLHKIFLYSVDYWSVWEALSLERVCKAMHRALRPEGIFWDLYCGKDLGPLGDDDSHPLVVWDMYYREGEDECSRFRAFQSVGLRCIREHQGTVSSPYDDDDSDEEYDDEEYQQYYDQNPRKRAAAENYILSVLEQYEDGNAADNFRWVAAGVMAKMKKRGSPCIGTPRLRGDTVGYLAELVQEYAIDRLQSALLVAIHGGRKVVTKDDILLLDKTRSPCALDPSSTSRCSVGTNQHHAQKTSNSSSCCCPTSSGTRWTWPEDDCLVDDIIPAEGRRKIVRRLAYRAGILQMTSEAFDVVAAEVLHLIGVLLVDAFEASKALDCGLSSSLVDRNTSTCLTYGTPGDGIDMFSDPPPPVPITKDDDEDHGLLYTIVPGQIKEAARKRFEGRSVSGTVYGLSWPTSTGFSVEEEQKEEMSYYGKAAEGLTMEGGGLSQYEGSGGESTSKWDEAEEMDCEYEYESDGYETEIDDDDDDVISIGDEFQFWF